MLENTLYGDEVLILPLKDEVVKIETRFGIRTTKKDANGEYKYLRPDARSLFQLVKAWNLKN